MYVFLHLLILKCSEALLTKYFIRRIKMTTIPSGPTPHDPFKAAGIIYGGQDSIYGH